MSELEPIWDRRAEAAVIGSLLIDSGAFAVLSQQIVETDFYAENHRLLWKACSRVAMSGEPIDPITLQKALVEMKALKKIGGPSELVGLLNAAPAWSNAPTYAQIVREYSSIRQIADVAREVLHDCHNKARTSEDRQGLANRSQRKLFEAVQPLTKNTTRNSGHQTVGQVAMELLLIYEKTQSDDVDVDHRVTLTTTFPSVDKVVEIPVRALTVVAGPPGSGKSCIVRQMAFGWEKIGEKPHIIAIEDKNWHYIIREVASITGVNSRLVRDIIFKRDVSCNAEEIDQVLATLVKLGHSEWTMNDTSGLTVEQVAMQAREAVAEGATAIIVETFTRIKHPKWPGATKLEKVDHNIHGLTEVANELNVPFVVTAHIRRIEGNRLPTMHDIRDSGNWENNARVIIIPHRTDTKSLLIIAKANHDGTDIIPMIFEPTTTTWRELGYQDRSSPL